MTITSYWQLTAYHLSQRRGSIVHQHELSQTDRTLCTGLTILADVPGSARQRRNVVLIALAVTSGSSHPFLPSSTTSPQNFVVTIGSFHACASSCVRPKPSENVGKSKYVSVAIEFSSSVRGNRDQPIALGDRLASPAGSRSELAPQIRILSVLHAANLTASSSGPIPLRNYLS